MGYHRAERDKIQEVNWALWIPGQLEKRLGHSGNEPWKYPGSGPPVSTGGTSAPQEPSRDGLGQRKARNERARNPPNPSCPFLPLTELPDPTHGWDFPPRPTHSVAPFVFLLSRSPRSTSSFPAPTSPTPRMEAHPALVPLHPLPPEISPNPQSPFILSLPLICRHRHKTKPCIL